VRHDATIERRPVSGGAADLRRTKRAIRRRILARRDAMSQAERARADVRIHDRACAALDALARSDTVMAFWSFGTEVATVPLIERLVADGRRVALPRIEERDVRPRVYRPGDPLTPTSFGAMEPAAGEPLIPHDVDVVLTPGVAFDRLGHRIGYGGGFYDRFLPTTRSDAVKMAICYAIQVVDRVPSAAFDVPVGLIVTEDELIHAEERASGSERT
jgi:5-formyltetrahydrofolate cyclo-ligase